LFFELTIGRSVEITQSCVILCRT